MPAPAEPTSVRDPNAPPVHLWTVQGDWGFPQQADIAFVYTNALLANLPICVPLSFLEFYSSTEQRVDVHYSCVYCFYIFLKIAIFNARSNIYKELNLSCYIIFTTNNSVLSTSEVALHRQFFFKFFYCINKRVELFTTVVSFDLIQGISDILNH